jgi:hypothetical protein
VIQPLAWGKALTAAATLTALAIGVLALPDQPPYDWAKILLTIAAFLLAGNSILWGVATSKSWWIRMLVLFLVFGAIGTVTVEVIRRVEQMRDTRMKLIQATQGQTQTPNLSAPASREQVQPTPTANVSSPTMLASPSPPPPSSATTTRRKPSRADELRRRKEEALRILHSQD